ncbi:MAG: hypothetical protein ATN31_03870 [Candidatus Epulonipiscioides saccharophilum]|nr:MAG: hypothetical protein ATN31_03870 [Epulopiscium sp. AS2M-Bin001]
MILKQQGYQTAWIGKNHVPVGQNGYTGGYMESTFDYWYGNHNHSCFYPKENRLFGAMYKNAKLDTQVEIFEEGALNFLDPQAEFIESAHYPLIYRDKNKPFCMCVTFNLPHDAGTETMQLRETDDEIYKTLYRDKAFLFNPPATYIAYEDIIEPRLPRDLYSGKYIPSYDYVKTPESLRERQIRISQTITGVDRFIGHVIEKLKELDIYDNTIIVFSTDHGIHHGEHGIGGKCFLYEEDLKIPMIIFDPRSEVKNYRVKEMVVVEDLAPTILDLVGLDIPDHMQGNSLKDLMSGKEVAWRDEILLEQMLDRQNYPKSEGIRTKDWKYIRYFKRTEDPNDESSLKWAIDDYTEFLLNSWDPEYKNVAYEELYDLVNDASEITNLANNPEYADILEQFRKRMPGLIKEFSLPNHEERILDLPRTARNNFK